MAVLRTWDTRIGDVPQNYSGVKHTWDVRIGDVPNGINPSATSVTQFDTFLGEVNTATGLPEGDQ